MAQDSTHQRRTIIRNCRVFDGISDSVSENADVLIEGNVISAVSASPIGDAPGVDTTVIDAGGRFLMPGMSDAHVHLMGNANGYLDFVTGPTGVLFGNTFAEARRMLMRGFTSVRDMGGDTAPVQTLIDRGEFEGPRIFPSQAMISQTSGTATSPSSTRRPIRSTAPRAARTRSVSPAPSTEWTVCSPPSASNSARGRRRSS